MAAPALEEDVDASIDAIGGASAGAIVGLFSAHCVLSGADPVALLREAWVEKVSRAERFTVLSATPSASAS